MTDRKIPLLLTLDEVAARLERRPDRVRQMMFEGEIGYLRLRPVMFLEEHVQEVLDFWERRRIRSQKAAEDFREELVAKAAAREHRRKAVVPVLQQAENGVWYLNWSEGRRSKRLSTRTRDKAAAGRFLRRWLEENR